MGDIWQRVTGGEGRISGGSRFLPGKGTLAAYIGRDKLYATPEEYIRDSIYNPGSLLVSGFGNQMPTFKGQLNERAIDALIGMMKNLDEFNPDGSFKYPERIEEAEQRSEQIKRDLAEAQQAEGIN